MNIISNCRICNCEEIIPVFDLGQHPFANSLLKKNDAYCKKYPLSLSWCPDCNLVQLDQTAEPKDLFSNYVWVTGTSSTARKYALHLCKSILSYDLTNCSKKNGFVLELASNDGTFLKPFKEKGYKILGVDPAQNIVNKANSDGVFTICCFFGESVANKILLEHGSPEILLVRNVLPHVANLHDFVKGIQLLTSDNTLTVIEIHYAKVILDECHYDSIYHEHLCYFSVKSIEKLLNRYELYITNIMESPISGGSIVLFVKNKPEETNSTLLQYKNNEQNNNTNELKSWEKFSEKSFLHKSLLINILKEEKSKGNTIAGYGASARSSTMLNFCNINSDFISIIADQNELKKNLYTAGSNILIDSPESVMMNTKPDTIFVLAWNFLDEITKILRNRFGFKGKLIVPLPGNPKIIDS